MTTRVAVFVIAALSMVARQPTVGTGPQPSHHGSPRGWVHFLHPITGKPYTKEETDRLKYLRLQFPDNPLVPKTLSAEEVADLEDSADRFVTMWGASVFDAATRRGRPCLDRRYITNGPAVSGPERPGWLLALRVRSPRCAFCSSSRTA